MAGLASASIDVTKITKERLKDGKWLNISINIDDETGQYGHNVSIYEALTKEERDAKEKRNYIGNGKVVYTANGTMVVAEKTEKAATTTKVEDLPF